MDPGILMIISMLAHPAAAVVGGYAVYAGAHQYLSGHERGESTGAIKHILIGGLATGLTWNAATIAPAIVTAASQVRILAGF